MVGLFVISIGFPLAIVSDNFMYGRLLSGGQAALQSMGIIA